MLALGEFEGREQFENHEDTVLIYCFFILATFFTQITFLNMIISIMSDVYDEVNESQHIFSLQIKLEMVADYACIIKDNNSRGDPSSQGEQGNYLFVVTPVEEDGSNSESW